MIVVKEIDVSTKTCPQLAPVFAERARIVLCAPHRFVVPLLCFTTVDQPWNQLDVLCEEHRADGRPMTRRFRFLLLVFFGLMGLRVLIGERPFDYVGPRALLDALFALGLTLIVFITAIGWGQLIVRRLGQPPFSPIEQIVFSAALGLGVLGYGILALGLVGWLRPWAILLWLGISVLAARRTWLNLLCHPPAVWSLVKQGWQKADNWLRVLAVIGCVTFVIVLLQALTPLWDYDGQMYHLQAPRLFLQVSRIELLPDNWQANGPATPDLLNLFGLVFGSETFAKLLHLTYGVLVALATFAFAQRWRSRPVGGFAVAVLLTMPMLPVLASWAYTDLTWTLYEFLTLWAVVTWSRTRDDRWLVVAGCLGGLALGSKYQAIGQVAILGAWIVWQTRRIHRGLRPLIIYAGLATMIAAPWYVKNFVLSGNPIYPLVFGGPGWDCDRLAQLMSFLYGFGTGRAPIDFILLPLNLYVHRAAFTALLGGLEWPGVLFLCALAYPIGWRKRPLRDVAVVTGLRFGVWAIGSQQLRFLVPVYPALSVLTADVIVTWSDRAQGSAWRWILANSIVGSLMLVSLILLIGYSIAYQPLGTLVGFESKEVFLRQRGTTYAAVQFVMQHLAPSDRVLLMWDGRGYYCDERCIPDTEQSKWTQIVGEQPTIEAVSKALSTQGVTHLLFSVGDADFMSQHDLSGRQRRSAEFFLNEYRAACTRLLYLDDRAALYETTCH